MAVSEPMEMRIGSVDELPLSPPTNEPQNLRTGLKVTCVFYTKMYVDLPRVTVFQFPSVEPYGHDDPPNKGTITFFHAILGIFPSPI